MDIRTKSKIRNRLHRIYKKTLSEDWINELCDFIDERKNKTPRKRPGWDEKQVFLITYGRNNFV